MIHLLLVTNDGDLAKLARHAFASRADDFRMTVASKLSEARTALHAAQPNLLIVDLALPDGAGTELLPPNSQTAPFPIVLLTSQEDEQAAIEAVSNGAVVDYAVKSAAVMAEMPHIARRALRMWQLIEECEQATQRERQLVAQLARTDRQNKMGEMATLIAHETNQPLAAMANYAGTCVDLIDRREISHQEIRDACSQIYQQARHAGEIINRLRRFVANVPPKRSGVDLSELIQEACDLMASQIQTHQAAVLLELDDSISSIRADAIQIQQVLVNLIQNSLEAMIDTQPNYRQIIISTAQSAVGVRVRVRDRGAGISPQVAERLFEPHFTTKSGGLGMGLNLCQRIVQSHGGRLSNQSNPDRGAIFQFTLPLDPDLSPNSPDAACDER